MCEFGPCSRGATQSMPDSESATRSRKYLCNSADVVTIPSELNVQLHRPVARLTLADGDERRRHWGTLTAMARMLAPDALFASWGALGCVRAPCFARDVASTWAVESGCTAISAFSAHRPRTSPNIYAYFLENSTRTIAFPCLRLQNLCTAQRIPMTPWTTKSSSSGMDRRLIAGSTRHGLEERERRYS